MISSLLCLSVLVSNAFAAPKAADGTAGGLSVNLQRRVRRDRTTEELGEWARTQREAIHTKYGRSMPQRRSTGTNLIVNQNTDSSFYGSLAIGTPAVSYNVILDTGSADLWVADSNCASGCSSIPTFDTTSSSTYTNSSDAFKITYGSGAASGSLGKDTIQMAGFSVPDQVFGVCDVISSGLVSDPVSGLLGLAWESIAASGAMPFWQTLVAGGAWDEPLMAFQLTRFIGVSGAQSLEPGGTFTMGSLNTSLYTGDIDYIDLVNSGSYWMIPLTSLTVQGSSVTVGSGSNAYAAIDTGTTLVGGPADEIAAIYALIPDAVAGTGNYEGYYLYPCDTAVNVTVSFGGQDWTISSDDFQSNQVSRDQCMGSFFEFEGGSSGPTWIFGDTFLKNVYSVFRYDSPAVGFAQLSDVALAMNGDVRAAVPAATIGSIAAQVSATSVVDRTNGALSGSSISPALTFVAALSTVFILLS